MINEDTLKMKISLHSINSPVLSSNLEIDLRCSGSEIREGVRALRRVGVPIASCSDGYFLADSFKEIEPTLDDLRSRMKSLAITANMLAKAFNVDLQEDLFTQ